MSGYFIILALVEPMYATALRPIGDFKKVLRIAFVILEIFLIGSQVGMLATVGDSEVFTVCICAQLFATALYFFVLSVIMWVQVRKFRRLVLTFTKTSGSDNVKLRTFLGQLNSLEKVIRHISLNTSMAGLAVVIIVLGSMPYQFVFWALNRLSIWPMSLQIRGFLIARNDAPKHHSPDPTETMISNVAVAGDP